MAGKTGFYGFNNKFLMNRFFSGGHGLYFAGDTFMLQHWIPLLDDESRLPEIDERINGGIVMRVLENVLVALSFLKPWLYFSFALLIIYLVWT